jgi:hypothetical protein
MRERRASMQSMSCADAAQPLVEQHQQFHHQLDADARLFGDDARQAFAIEHGEVTVSSATQLAKRGSPSISDISPSVLPGPALAHDLRQWPRDDPS